ncbi:Ferric iron ABC transporter [Klebsiella oxytoca]|nr:Ferric iron ABC transporter [Klebsiella oxytoca]
MNILRRKWQGLPRGIVVLITALAIYVPLLFIVVQSFLSAPFFARSKAFSLEAYEFIFTDPDFYLALKIWLYSRLRPGGDRHSSRRDPRLFNGAHRFTRQTDY